MPTAAPAQPAYAPPVGRTRVTSIALAVVALPVVAAACGDDGDSGATLPPIITTTSTTSTLAVTTTTVLVYYEVQPGDSLAQIAQSFGVKIEAIVALNDLTDPDHIEVGQILQIPPPIPITDTLPTTTSSSTTSTTAA